MKLGYLLELRQGWPFKARFCSATSGLLSSGKGHVTILLDTRQCNREASPFEVVYPGSLSSCHRDIGIPINF